LSARCLFVSAIQRLCQIHQRQKFPAIAEAVLATCILGELEDVVVVEVAGGLPAAQ
jgi:hypothetical protein